MCDSNNSNRAERRDLLAFDNTSTKYKRRKIKTGINHNIDMNEYYNKIENELNLDDFDNERKNTRKVWSNSKNPLSNEEIEIYLKTAKIFWDYRNLNIENELNNDFQDEIILYINENKTINNSKRNTIESKLIELKKFVEKGVNLNCHFDEMALKILHISKYKIKMALFFLYKSINPFIEGNNKIP